MKNLLSRGELDFFEWRFWSNRCAPPGKFPSYHNQRRKTRTTETSYLLGVITGGGELSILTSPPSSVSDTSTISSLLNHDNEYKKIVVGKRCALSYFLLSTGSGRHAFPNHSCSSPFRDGSGTCGSGGGLGRRCSFRHCDFVEVESEK